MRTLLIAIAVSLIACASAWATAPISLTPAELTSAEAATYRTLKDADAQKSFLDTRGFLRLSQKVMAGELPALELPRQPEDYDTDYVTDAEQKIVDDAVLKYVSARIGGAFNR
jgi:hypothetical protein